MKILLTGASSYVGARIYFELTKKHQIVGTYNGSKLSNEFIRMDITDKTQVENVITKEKPDIIIHAAASADARWCEANPEKAIKLNQEATSFIVEASNKVGAKIIYISSYAAINPSNVYGKTKLQSEVLVKQNTDGYIILRPSLIIGYSPNTKNDRPFNRILKNLDEQTEAIYDNSWKFQPTSLGHIAEIIEKLLESSITNETIHIATPELVTRYDLAKDILAAFDIIAKPIDKGDTTPTVTDSLKKLKELNLPVYSYREIIEAIIVEIKHREIYTLQNK